jgi:hypothetical protein
VFPGGNLDPKHDGQVPDVHDKARHEDGVVYRVGAIRECFEESGIILAKKKGTDRLLEVDDAERERGRHAIHEHKINFQDWVKDKDGELDTEGLIPFTRWITPPNIPKRFTTQMYIYFLPLSNSSLEGTALAAEKEAVIPTPTSDGGLEHTTAKFLPAEQWLKMAQSGEIILFPPQFFLLHLVAPFLKINGSKDEMAKGREELKDFVKTSDPPFTDKCISPTALLWKEGDGRAAMSLEKPGLELEGTSRRGEKERVVLVKFSKEGPRQLEVAWRKDVFKEERSGKL